MSKYDAPKQNYTSLSKNVVHYSNKHFTQMEADSGYKLTACKFKRVTSSLSIIKFPYDKVCSQARFHQAMMAQHK